MLTMSFLSFCVPKLAGPSPPCNILGCSFWGHVQWFIFTPAVYQFCLLQARTEAPVQNTPHTQAHAPAALPTFLSSSQFRPAPQLQSSHQLPNHSGELFLIHHNSFLCMGSIQAVRHSGGLP